MAAPTDDEFCAAILRIKQPLTKLIDQLLIVSRLDPSKDYLDPYNYHRVVAACTLEQLTIFLNETQLYEPRLAEVLIEVARRLDNLNDGYPHPMFKANSNAKKSRYTPEKWIVIAEVAALLKVYMTVHSLNRTEAAKYIHGLLEAHLGKITGRLPAAIRVKQAKRSRPYETLLDWLDAFEMKQVDDVFAVERFEKQYLWLTDNLDPSHSSTQRKKWFEERATVAIYKMSRV